MPTPTPKTSALTLIEVWEQMSPYEKTEITTWAKEGDPGEVPETEEERKERLRANRFKRHWKALCDHPLQLGYVRAATGISEG